MEKIHSPSFLLVTFCHCYLLHIHPFSCLSFRWGWYLFYSLQYHTKRDVSLSGYVCNWFANMHACVLMTKACSSQSHGFSRSHVAVQVLDYKESWVPKNWCFWTVLLEKTLESPLDCKEIQPVHPKGNKSWTFVEMSDAEAETPILWPPDAKSWLIGEYPDAGKDWRQEEKGMAEDEMLGWHYQLKGHEFEQAPGVGDGQGSLMFCSPWCRKESDVSERLNWTDACMLSHFSCVWLFVTLWNVAYQVPLSMGFSRQ